MAAGTVRVRLFASLREIAGEDELELELKGSRSIDACWEVLCRRHPGLSSWRERVKPARNLEYVEWEAEVTPGDELAFLPPVSGGSFPAEPVIWVKVDASPIDTAELAREVERSGIGAIATFDGLVRSPDQGEEVPRLEYEAYPEMAEPVLREICLEACRRFGATTARVQHRTGTVLAGGTSVAVAVGAPHRRQALDACAYVIDELKSRAPIWKSGA